MESAFYPWNPFSGYTGNLVCRAVVKPAFSAPMRPTYIYRWHDLLC